MQELVAKVKDKIFDLVEDEDYSIFVLGRSGDRELSLHSFRPTLPATGIISIQISIVDDIVVFLPHNQRWPNFHRGNKNR